MNTIISFAPLTGLAIIIYIVYRNIKNKGLKTFTINSHQDDSNVYRGGDMFEKKERIIKPSWNKFTLAFFVLYMIVMFSKSPVWIGWFQAIFPPYLIIYLIVKLVKWYKGINPNSWFSSKHINEFDRKFYTGLGTSGIGTHSPGFGTRGPEFGSNLNFSDDDD
jgi:hypothetical protein